MGKRRDVIKVLYFDQSGFAMIASREGKSLAETALQFYKHIYEVEEEASTEEQAR